MATKLTHKCIICGTRYHSCDTCDRIRTYTPWRSICDSFEHYKIYLALRAYEEGIADKDETRSVLEDLGVKKGAYDNWNSSSKNKLDAIFAEPKRVKKVKVEEPVVEIPVEAALEDIVEMKHTEE